MCVHIGTHVCIYKHVYIYIDIYIYITTYITTYVYIYIYIYTYVYMYICIGARGHRPSPAGAPARVRPAAPTRWIKINDKTIKY